MESGSRVSRYSSTHVPMTDNLLRSVSSLSSALAFQVHFSPRFSGCQFTIMDPGVQSAHVSNKTAGKDTFSRTAKKIQAKGSGNCVNCKPSPNLEAPS